jgi:hypothetical protein
MGDLLNTAKGAIDPMTGDLDPMALVSEKRRAQLGQERKALETLSAPSSVDVPGDAQDGSEETAGSQVMSTFGNVASGRVSPLEALLGAVTGEAAAPVRRGNWTPLDLVQQPSGRVLRTPRMDAAYRSAMKARQAEQEKERDEFRAKVGGRSGLQAGGEQALQDMAQTVMEGIATLGQRRKF